MAETIRNLESQYVFKGTLSSCETSEPGQRTRSKSYYEPPTSVGGDDGEFIEGKGQESGVGKSMSMSEIESKTAAGSLW